MKLKIVILLVITSLYSLSAEEDHNFFLGFGSGITNHTLDYAEEIGPTNITMLDLLFNSNFAISYESFCLGNENLSVVSKLTLAPARIMGDFSVSLAYNINSFQFLAGPSVIYDQYFPIVRTLFNVSNALGSNDKFWQFYWLFVGAEVGFKYQINKNMGISIQYKHSFADISHLFLEVDKDNIVGNFYLLNLNFFIRLKDGI